MVILGTNGLVDPFTPQDAMEYSRVFSYDDPPSTTWSSRIQFLRAEPLSRASHSRPLRIPPPPPLPTPTKGLMVTLGAL